MKIAFGMIVFEGDYVLQECLSQVYPFASQILIAEGPVSYWQKKGRTTSTDNTNYIIDNFPDPDGKIKIIHSQYNEKDDQCNAYIKYLNDDIDYLWNLDSDEVYKKEDLKKMLTFLDSEKPSSVGVRSCTFYGGLEKYLTGFELKTDNFKRIFRVTPGSKWLTHRPPTIKYPADSNIYIKHVNSDELYSRTGVQMYHYSYVFPNQVYNKIKYYKEVISGKNAIDDYFDNVYFPWMLGDTLEKERIENIYNGVHEFKPEVRGECRTSDFKGDHPESILRSMEIINLKIKNQLDGIQKK